MNRLVEEPVDAYLHPATLVSMRFPITQPVEDQAQLQLSEERDRRFMQAILAVYPPSNYAKNPEAQALFFAIQHAFLADYSRKEVSLIRAELVSNLAACAWVAMEYDADQVIPWDTSTRDFVILRTLRDFMYTVAQCVRNNEVTVHDDGKTWLNGFLIPEWFIQEVREEERERAEDERLYRELCGLDDD